MRAETASSLRAKAEEESSTASRESGDGRGADVDGGGNRVDCGKEESVPLRRTSRKVGGPSPPPPEVASCNFTLTPGPSKPLHRSLIRST